MGRHDLEYPRDATNTVKRRGQRGIYALERIHQLVNSCPLLHVSLNVPDSPFPATLPMIGQMGSFDRPSADLGDPLDIYIHGYVSSRMFNLGRRSTTGEDQNDGEGTDTSDKEKPKGIPVCVSATHVDGIVLALSSFNHSYNYRSAVLFGHATIVEDPEERLYAMELITNGVIPGRWSETRLPPTSAEMQSTGILKVKVASGSAKIRDGGVLDDQHDLDNEAEKDRIWTGVLPFYNTIGEPLPGPSNRIPLAPHVADFVEEFNKDNKEQATTAAKK